MLDDTEINPVHIPADPNKFAFDGEVAKIFPNMAERSIPNYHEFHKLHAEIAARWFARDNAAMIDIGASHGAFYSALKEFYHNGLPGEPAMPKMYLMATDNSPEMCEAIREKHKDVTVFDCSVTDSLRMHQISSNLKFDVVNCTYVIQFLHPSMQYAALQRVSDMVRPGGILILGQKEQHSGVLGEIMHQQYINWRLSNGYTRAEIEAKSRALKGSMWPIYQDQLLGHLQNNFREIMETTRTGMFSTLIAYK